MVLDTAIKIAGRRKVPLEYIVIRPDEAICAARAAERTEGRITDYAICHDLYLSFNEAARYIIKDDENDAAVTAGRILQAHQSGKFFIT